MDEETLAGAKRFQDWMDKEEIRMKNSKDEIIVSIEKPKYRLPMLRELPKIDRQLQLF